MKSASGFLFLLGLSMILNAALGKWAFTETSAGTGLIVLDVVIGLAFFAASFVLWQKAEREDASRLWAAMKQQEEAHLLHERLSVEQPPRTDS